MSVLMLEDWQGRTFEVQTVRDDILRVASGEDLVGAVIHFDSGPAGTLDAADGVPLHPDLPRWVACRRKDGGYETAQSIEWFWLAEWVIGTR